MHSPHAPLRRKYSTGKLEPRPVPADEWHPGMPTSVSKYPTQDKKAYPLQFNSALVDLMAKAIATTSESVAPPPAAAADTADDHKTSPSKTARTDLSSSTKSLASSRAAASVASASTASAASASSSSHSVGQPQPIKPVSLRGNRPPSKKETRDHENDAAAGGMRNPTKAHSHVPRAQAVGRRLANALRALLLASQADVSMSDSLGTSECKGFWPTPPSKPD